MAGKIIYFFNRRHNLLLLWYMFIKKINEVLAIELLICVYREKVMDIELQINTDFKDILTKNQSQIRAYIAGIGVPFGDVDDIAQEVFLEFYHNQDKLPQDTEPIRWLKGIARNKSYRFFRNAKYAHAKKYEYIAEQLSYAQPVISDESETEATLALRSCMEDVSEENRQIINLTYTDNLTSQQVAESLQMNSDAIRARLFRLRKTLKDCVRGKMTTEFSHA